MEDFTKLEQKEKEKLIAGVLVFVFIAVIFFIEFFFAIFSVAISSLTLWVLGFFSIQSNFWYNFIFNMIGFNIPVIWSYYKYKKNKPK